MATGKRIYDWVTRGMLNFADREGGGLRLMVIDAPALTACAEAAPRGARRGDRSVPRPPERRRALRLHRIRRGRRIPAPRPVGDDDGPGANAGAAQSGAAAPAR